MPARPTATAPAEDTGAAPARPSRGAATRARILAAAGKLFQAEGIRAVGVDAVAEKAGITKRTLYYHFRSKDDLIAAHLEARDQPNLATFQRWFEAADGDVADRIAAIFGNLAEAARHPKWRGCGFLRTAAELVGLPGHPALVVGRAHKKRVEAWLEGIVATAGAPAETAPALARQVVVLLDGGFATVLLHRDPAYMEAAGEAAAALVRAATGALARA